MNTKSIYTILAVIVIVFLGYYFINNQTSTNQLPINNNTDKPITPESVQNESESPSLSVNDDGYFTYANKHLGFSIDYPKDWYWDATNQNKLLLTSDIDAVIEGWEVPYDVAVNIYKSSSELPNNPDKLDFEGWIGQIAEDPTFTNKTEIMVDGVKGYQGISHGMFSSYTIHVENNSSIYSIYINNSVLPEIVEQVIINSFRFI